MITMEERLDTIIEGASTMPFYSAGDIIRCCFRYCNGNGADILDAVKYAVARYLGKHNDEETEFNKKLEDVYNRLS